MAEAHGHWIMEGPYKSAGGHIKKLLECSECHTLYVSDGFTQWHFHNYCPNCGTRMDGMPREVIRDEEDI